MLCKTIHFRAVREPFIMPSGFGGDVRLVLIQGVIFLISMLDLRYSANVSGGKAVDNTKHHY